MGGSGLIQRRGVRMLKDRHCIIISGDINKLLTLIRDHYPIAIIYHRERMMVGSSWLIHDITEPRPDVSVRA
jgi:hypothetical protein